MKTSITTTQLRQFGVILSIGVLLIFGLLLPYLAQKQAPEWVLIMAIPVALLALIVPILLKPFYIVWMKIGLVLGWINTRIILGIIFYTVFMPAGLIMRLFAKDPMARRFNDNVNTYRVVTNPSDAKKMEKPY